MIVGTFSKIPKKTSSHSYGYARTWSENLDVPIDHTNGKHKDVYLLPGANFGGTINLMGGFTELHKVWIDNLLASETITVLDGPPVDYGAQLKKRKDVTDKGWCDAITEKLSEAKSLVGSDLPHEWLAIGDSHVCAYAPKNSSVVKQDGTTLFGQIKEDFAYIRSHIKPHHKGVTISLGNIDVRHHLCRVQTDIYKMVDAYSNFGRSLGIEVEYAVPWPIEFEGRKLPKTGYYKGKPFWGDRGERMLAAWNMEGCMKIYGMKLVKAPQAWYDMDEEKFAIDRMEKPQSVHLNPMFYRRMNWGESENTLESFM